MKVSSATLGAHEPRACRTLCWLLSLALACALADTAGAQTASQNAAATATGPQPVGASAASSGESAAGLQQIVVTARKVTERLQDVPMSVTALSSESLEQSGAINLQDIGREVAGLSVVSLGPGQNQLILRGLSSSGGDAMVGYYIDDTPISTPTLNFYQTNAIDPSLFDLNRVEVLRGPQGTLYGASSMGGTVKYVTNQPDPTAFSFAVKESLSDTDGGGLNDELDTLINVPVISDVAAIRALAYYKYDDGYINQYPTAPDNYLAVLPGPVDKDINTDRTYGTRVVMEIKPNDSLIITPAVFYQNMDLGAPFTFDSPPGTFDDPIQSRLTREPYTDKATLYSLTVQGDISAVHITSSTSYFDHDTDFLEDDSKVNYYYFSPVPQSYVYPTPFDNEFKNYNFTEELRATGTFGRLHALVGVFYTHVASLALYSFPIPAGYNQAFGDPFGNQIFYGGHVGLTDVQKAVFSELNYDITDRLQATLGARYFNQSQTDNSFITGVYNGGPSLNVGRSSANGVTPKYELSYKVTPDALAYATVSKGFREGGPTAPLPDLCNGDLANLGLTTHPTQYSPDSIWNYELGAKTQWLDNRLTLNADIYYIDWTNTQQEITLPTCGYVFTYNFGTAASKGAELEMRYQVTSSLQLGFSGAFNEAYLTSSVTGAQGQPGDTLENAPKWSGSAYMEYRRELGHDLSGYLRADINTTSHENNNFDVTSIYYNDPGYSLANLRLGATQNRWQYSLFVTNLFDKHAETGEYQSYAIDLPTTRAYSLNQPRTIGVDVRFDY
jgi:iron complex outermembrane recepter protein